MSGTERLPPLRPLEVSPFRNARNELYFALRDLTQVAPHPLAVSLPGYFVLSQLDGQRTCRDIQLAFLRQFGQLITTEQIQQVVQALDQALMLDSAAYHAAYAKLEAEYLASQTRDSRGRYPDADLLRAEIEALLARGSAQALPSAAELGDVCGIIAPHLDYQRGGPCYADAYAALARAAPAERYVILGTNHFGRSSTVVATGKDFSTPLGQVATDQAFIRRLEAALGTSICRHEFDHNAEHSVELQVHILQVLHGSTGRFRIVPILCPDPCDPGRSTAPDGAGPGLTDFADALGRLVARDRRRTVLIAGADLSHVGQHFGDPGPTTRAFLRQIARADRHLLRLLEARREEEFVAMLRASQNPTRICSAGCIYALLRALPDRPCRVLRYHQAVCMEAETHVTCMAAVVGAGSSRPAGDGR